MLRLLTAVLLLLDPGGPRGTGFQEDRTAGVRLENSDIVLTGNGAKGGTGDGFRVKRPCWYEPGLDGAQMAKTQESLRAYWFGQTPGATEGRFQEFLKQFKEKSGAEGRWWKPAYNNLDPDGFACWNGLEPFVWVPPGATPPAGITLEELTQIARAALTVPEPRIKLNPDAKSYVNLPTWVWLGDLGPTTRSVTATLLGVMSATVTARLDAIKINSGTTADRGEVREDCGVSGRPYARGAEFTCGVRYLRASIDQPRQAYVLTVTTVWPVEADNDAVSFAYDPIEVGGSREVPVGEVQSTVRE